MGDLLVRPARLEDVPAILQLIAADAIRERRSRKIRHFVGSHLGMKLYLGGQA